MCHVDPGERGLGKGQGQQGEGKLQVKFRPALPHTVSASAWTGRRRGGHSAQHLRSRRAYDRLILAIGLRLRLQLQLQARRCFKKVSLASLAGLLQSPNVSTLCEPAPVLLQCCTLIPTALCQAPALCPKPSVACMLLRGP
jgi:hypothetical protein